MYSAWARFLNSAPPLLEIACRAVKGRPVFKVIREPMPGSQGELADDHTAMAGDVGVLGVTDMPARRLQKTVNLGSGLLLQLGHQWR
jgi:hypothetical protein